MDLWMEVSLKDHSAAFSSRHYARQQCVCVAVTAVKARMGMCESG